MLDAEAEGLLTADGFTPAAEMVDELAADEVEVQLHLHNIAFDSLADESDLRKLLRAPP